jgi:hypothetical protein
MKKLLALAAMATMMASAAVAPMPVVAAEIPAHCAILPLLKAECRDAIAAAAKDPAATTVVASTTVAKSVSSAAASTSDAVSDAVDSVTGWSCVRTPDGPALFSCSK